MSLRSGTMASGRVATCVLVLFLWPLAVWHVPDPDWTSVSFIFTSNPWSHPRELLVTRRVREKKVRFEGTKQAETRKLQLRHNSGASISVLLNRLHDAAQEGDLREAENIFHLLCLPSAEDFRVNQHVINELISAAARRGNIERAKHWFGRLFDFNLDPDLAIFTSMISAGAEYGNLRFSEDWFEAMAYYQISPGIETYCAMMKAAANAKDLRCAEKWFYEAQNAGLQANEITFRTASCAALGTRAAGFLHSPPPH